MKSPGLFVIIFILLVGCGVNRQLLHDLNDLEKGFQHHTGFVLFDVEKNEVVFEKDAFKYFTPASNTKILTFYTAANIIEDSIPALYYVESSDSLVFWGSGDPGLLYKNLPNNKAQQFLAGQSKPLYFSSANFHDNHFGSGWAWDDYLYTFSSEKSPFPIYGNALTIRKQRESPYLDVDLTYFQKHFYLGDSLKKGQVTRSVGSNDILYQPWETKRAFKREVPFKTDGQTIAKLLTDTITTKVTHIDKKRPATYSVYYGTPADSAYKAMMQQSDNFIAEQLLLVCAGIISDSLSTEVAINWAQEALLSDSPDPIVWKDGSGLSRYNLITPRSVVWLWSKLYQQLGRDRLFSLIAAGGRSGTLENYYSSNPPYIYGKTGTLSNNHNLSGFLITKSGKLLIFSFMNNNYPTESGPVKKEMEKILRKIHLNY